MERIEIPESDYDKPLSPGDRFELHYRCSGMTYIKAMQIYQIEKGAAERDDFKIIRIWVPDDQPTKMVITVEVLKSNPVVCTLLLICAIILLLAGFSGLFKPALEKAYKLAQSPGVQVGLAGAGLALPIAALVVIFGVLGLKK